ncbi:unnamed protein product [Caenorhabditis sp. 36 PRJEB53466]|nr:unnamed protein product [Caenorhabditis sp. 36 PRJEB53466]
MPQQLTSLESDSELDVIAKSNNRFEKRCAEFERQKRGIDRNMRMFETCNLHVKRMVSHTKEKMSRVKEEVDEQLRKTQLFVQDSLALLDSTLDKVDSIRSSSHNSISNGYSTLSIMLPYADCIQKYIETNEITKRKLAELTEAEELLKKNQEDLKRQEDIVSKSLVKTERDVIDQKEEVQRQKRFVDDVRKTAEASQKKLAEAREENATEGSIKTEAQEKVKEAEKMLNDLETILKEKADVESAEIDRMENLVALYSELDSSVGFNEHLISDLPDQDELNRLVDEWAAFDSARKQQLKSLSPLSSDVVISEKDTVDRLRTSLENVKKEKNVLLNESEQMHQYREKFLSVKGTLEKHQLELEALEAEIERNNGELIQLQVTEKSAKLPKTLKTRRSRKEEAFQLLQASKTDIPQPPSFSKNRHASGEYQTPSAVLENSELIPGRRNVPCKTRKSVESDSTRPILHDSFPGIKVISQEKSNVELDSEELEQSAGHLTEDDDSLDINDSGDTQNTKEMFDFWGDHNAEEPEGKDATPVEFSMNDHMNDYNKRLADKQAARPTSRSNSPVAKEDESENNERRNLGSESADDDDSDDSLMASDEQDGTLDQSTWSD